MFEARKIYLAWLKKSKSQEKKSYARDEVWEI